MSDLVRFVVGLVADLVRRRASLVAENAILRQQLIVAQRKIVGRVRWAPWQRFTMALAARIAPAWRAAVLLVQPATILRWHKAAPEVLSLEVRRLERDVLGRLRDLRGVFQRNPTRAREALEGLLVDKLTFTPTETARGKRYEVRGRLAVGGLLQLPAAFRMVASPGRRDHSGTHVSVQFEAAMEGWELELHMVG